MSSTTVTSQPNSAMPDVQGKVDRRNIAIDKVGVRNVTYPIRLRRAPSDGGGEQGSVAKIGMYVSLPKEQKGTHMSRFMEVLSGYDQAIQPTDIPVITRAIRDRLGSADAHFSAEFTYFVKKFAPVTKQPSLMDYQVSFQCDVGPGSTDTDLVLGVKAPATSLCPCSKEISAYGAHNQRCLIEAKVRFRGELWIEDLVRILEGAASMELYGVLKRPDEKYVTEKAYENPKFVEDIVRDLAIALDHDERITWYWISSTNFESIHSHDAYAQIERRK